MMEVTKMIEYRPWSQAVLEESLNSYKQGGFNILDIELGGQCNYHCIYCDSPSRDKHCRISIDQLQVAFEKRNIKWVFVCGLGEPTAFGNMQVLLDILKLCEKYGAKCSIFSNLSTINSDLEYFIKKQILHILFKYDSRDIAKNMNLYGVPNVNKQLFNIEKIKKLVTVEDNTTNIAASIVPTKINKVDIIEIVKDCLDHNIFPLIAELENSGDAQEYYSQLALSDDELKELKSQIDHLIQEDYKVPVCPSVIGGVHIRHDGQVTVDKFTGLSCHWFWLEEPQTCTVGDFNSDKYENIVESIINYRKTKIDFVRDIIDVKKKSIFGGCGGDATYLLQRYLEICKEGL